MATLKPNDNLCILSPTNFTLSDPNVEYFPHFFLDFFPYFFSYFWTNTSKWKSHDHFYGWLLKLGYKIHIFCEFGIYRKKNNFISLFRILILWLGHLEDWLRQNWSWLKQISMNKKKESSWNLINSLSAFNSITFFLSLCMKKLISILCEPLSQCT